MIADAATVVKELYSENKYKTVIKPRFYPRLLSVFNENYNLVISRVCACVTTSAEDDNFPRGEDGYNMILFNLLVFMFWFVRYKIIPGNFGLALGQFFSVYGLRDWGCMSKSVL